MPPGATGAHDPFLYIEDEENTALGDYLDHLSPRDISSMRYIQHHEWIEEVLSSPHAAGKIMPVDLGFGLSGELAQLTESIFEVPTSEDKKRDPTAPSLRYHKVEPEKFAEFEKRVDEYIKKGEQEIQAMKVDHAKNIAELRKSKTYMKAERKLREHLIDTAKLDGADPVEDVAEQVAKSLDVQIKPRLDVECI